MRAFGQSQGVSRREDLRFLTGNGRYLDDILPEGCLHAAFLRAPVAHAVITGLDTSDAAAMPGVHAVLTAEDLKAAGVTAGLWAVLTTDRLGRKGKATHRPVLADGVIRHVGEPIAIVVADTRALAQDAVEAIMLDFDERPAHLDLAPGGTPVHDTVPDNLPVEFHLGDTEAVEAAFAKAAHTTRLTVRQNRVTTVSMEPRAALAEWDGKRLHFAFNGQGVWNHKRELARVLNLDPEQVRATTPDVGGGFGMKTMQYPEQYATAQAAITLGKPVAWISDRSEAMLADNGARDLESTAELAFDADHRILAYRVETRSNLGAYNSQFGDRKSVV